MRRIEEKTLSRTAISGGVASGASVALGRLRRMLMCLSAVTVSVMAAPDALSFDAPSTVEEQGVVYDLDIIETFPPVGAVDMTVVTWDVTLITIHHDYDYRPGAQVSLRNAKGTYVRDGALENSSFTADRRTMKLVNPPEPSENGTYTLTIPQGTFGDEAWLADPQTGHSNPEIKVVWRVFNAAGTTADYDVSVMSTEPADKGSVDIASSPLEITVTGPGTLGYVEGVYADLVNEESDYHGKVRFVSASVQDGNTVFKTSITPEVTRDGTYTLNIPEGMFGDLPFAADCSEGHGNLPYAMSFEVTGGQPPKGPVQYDLYPEVTPADGSAVSFSDMQRLVFVFPEGTDWVNENDAKAALKCETANYYAPTLFRREPGKPGTFYLAVGSKVRREGVYTLVMNQGIFMDAEKEHSNPEITFTWNVGTTGIDGVEAENGAAPGVYDLDGVYRGADTDGLPAGVYVVKGRKVLVTDK